MFELPKLDYQYNALEPFISEETLLTHHSKHHATYVNKLNESLANYPDLLDTDIEDLLSNIENLPVDLQIPVTNNGGQHFNHSLYWQSMSPQKQKPSENVLNMINKSFGGWDDFKNDFTKAGLTQFGSGWVWLVFDGKDLNIEKTSNADSPIMHGRKPVLTMDVWEHAYYLDYKSGRGGYIEKFFDLINWENVEKLIG